MLLEYLNVSIEIRYFHSYKKQLMLRLRSISALKFLDTFEKAAYKLEITKKTLILFAGEDEKILEANHTEHSLYPVFYYLLYSIALECEILPIHSVSVTNGEKCHLILGGFREGKTTLGQSFLGVGYKYKSCDHSFLKIKGNKLVVTEGSSLNSYNGEQYFVDLVPSEVELTDIVCIKGLASEGIAQVIEVVDDSIKLFNIWDSITWINNYPGINFFHPKIKMNDIYTNKELYLQSILV